MPLSMASSTEVGWLPAAWNQGWAYPDRVQAPWTSAAAFYFDRYPHSSLEQWQERLVGREIHRNGNPLGADGALEAGDRLVVGMNAYTEGNEDQQVEILQIPHTVETEQCDRLARFRATRDADAAKRALDGIRASARAGKNVMPALVEGALAKCTLGEMVQAMADVYGRYSGGPEW